MKNKVNARWFQDRLRDKGMSQRGFAKLIDMDPAALSYAIQGKRQWKHDELVAFCTIVGVSFEEAAQNAGLALPSEGTRGTVAVVGSVDHAGEVRLGQVPAPRRAVSPPEAPEGTVAIRFTTSGTAADVLDGWLAYYVDGTKRVPPEAAGRLCVAWLPGRVTIGIVRRGYARGTHSVQPWVPGAAAIENAVLDRAAPVLWVRCG